MSGGGKPTRVLYVGNLPDDIRRSDIEYLFREEEGFGRVTRIDIKNGPPGTAYAFLDFENIEDAEDAADRRDGYDFEGEPLRVELKDGVAKGKGKGKHKDDHHDFRLENRVMVTGLPQSASWQDLKDHMREVGDVVFVEILKPGVGVCRYRESNDVKKAVKLLDRSIFRGHHGDVEIYVAPEEESRDRDDRSRSRHRR